MLSLPGLKPQSRCKQRAGKHKPVAQGAACEVICCQAAMAIRCLKGWGLEHGLRLCCQCQLIVNCWQVMEAEIASSPRLQQWQPAGGDANICCHITSVS